MKNIIESNASKTSPALKYEIDAVRHRQSFSNQTKTFCGLEWIKGMNFAAGFACKKCFIFGIYQHSTATNFDENREQIDDHNYNENDILSDEYYATIDPYSQYLLHSLQDKSHDIHLALLAIYYLNSYPSKFEEENGIHVSAIVQIYSKLCTFTDVEPVKIVSMKAFLPSLVQGRLIDRTASKTRANSWYYTINLTFKGAEIEPILQRGCPNCEMLHYNQI